MDFIQEGKYFIFGNTILAEGKEKTYLDLNKEEFEDIQKIIQPRLKEKHHDPSSFEFLFFLFKIFYQRKYESEEKNQGHFKIFEKNLKLINRVNKENRSFIVSINKFADEDEIELPLGLMKTISNSNDSQENQTLDNIASEDKLEHNHNPDNKGISEQKTNNQIGVVEKSLNRKNVYKIDRNIKSEIKLLKNILKGKSILKGFSNRDFNSFPSNINPLAKSSSKIFIHNVYYQQIQL